MYGEENQIDPILNGIGHSSFSCLTLSQTKLVMVLTTNPQNQVSLALHQSIHYHSHFTPENKNKKTEKTMREMTPETSIIIRQFVLQYFQVDGRVF